MANAKRVRIHIANPPAGSQDSTSLDHAKRYVKRGRAVWAGQNTIRFHEEAPAQCQAQQPTLPPVTLSPGFVYERGFTRYPLPMPGYGEKWPALSRPGAGMAA